MTTQQAAVQIYRRPRGQYPRRRDADHRPKPLPEYLEAHDLDALICAMPNARARLLFLVQWEPVSECRRRWRSRSGTSLDSGLPTIHLRRGKGAKPWIVPVHPELHSALAGAFVYTDDADLPGTGAGPDGEPCGCVVMNPTQPRKATDLATAHEEADRNRYGLMR